MLESYTACFLLSAFSFRETVDIFATLENTIMSLEDKMSVRNLALSYPSLNN